MVKRKVKKKKKKKLTPEEKKKIRLKKAFQKKIITSFKSASFEYIKTENIHKIFGLKRGDVDFVFLYKNIVLICEDTLTASKNIKQHMNKTKILFDNIKNDFEASEYKFLDWLKKKYDEKFSKFDPYDNSEYQAFFLYFYKEKLPKHEIEYMDYIKCVDEKALKYFQQITKIIKYSSRNEIFRFLGVDISRIGTVSSSTYPNEIDTAVISPESSSGLKKIKTVSFLMNAEDLMECGYVLRKDNWEESIELYQRLLINKKIESIRSYLLNEERGFINNVIVSLPEKVKFYKNSDKEEEIPFEKLNKIQNLTISIPRKINSLGIIDGQHRIYSYYESSSNIDEEKISYLRKKLHILVTGLFYHTSIKEREKRKFESKLFLEINHNAQKVSGDVLLYINSLQNPYSPEGMARQVIIELNKTKLFFDKFEVSLLHKSEIKSISFIKHALKDFLEINNDKETYFKYWTHKNKSILNDFSHEEFEKIFSIYISACASSIEEYFSAVRDVFRGYWKDAKNNKIFSVASIVGFFLAFKKSLKKHNIQDFEFYQTKLSKLKINFEKDDFYYSSSKGWGDFSRKILEECFDIKEEESTN